MSVPSHVKYVIIRQSVGAEIDRELAKEQVSGEILVESSVSLRER